MFMPVPESKSAKVVMAQNKCRERNASLSTSRREETKTEKTPRENPLGVLLEGLLGLRDYRILRLLAFLLEVCGGVNTTITIFCLLAKLGYEIAFD